MALALVLWALACVPQQAPAIPSGATAALDSAALALAKAGWVVEARSVAEILAELGYPAAMRTKLDAGIARESSKVKVAEDFVPEAAKKLQSAAKQLAGVLGKREGEARIELARKILVLDSEVDEAHAALGHIRVGSAWATPDERTTLERRLEIDRVRREIARLEVEIETGESQDEVLTTICGRPGVFARRGGHLVHSALDADRTARILREAERACAFSAYLRRGEIRLTPAKSGPLATSITVILDSRENFLRAVDAWDAEGRLKPGDAQRARELGAMSDTKGKTLLSPYNDTHMAASYLVRFSSLQEGVQTTLQSGHLNWVAMSYLGSPIPTYAYKESSGGVFHRGGTNIAPSGAALREREEQLKFAKAGIAGCRAWMAWMAENGQDPPWEDSFEDQIGKLVGEPLLKATSVVEFLQETGRLAPLIKASSQAGTASPKQVYEVALGMPLSAFEAEWRRWILPRAKGLAQRTGKASPKAPTAEEKAVLKALNQVRSLAFEAASIEAEDVEIERSLSDGAALHAIYLGQNPEEGAKWPDAHGERADSEGFTPEGAIAGGMSVIAFGVEQPEDAIDEWMGTFYHRTPLLEPGLLRIGFGWESDVAVMDVTSLLNPADDSWTVVWPYDGMKSVPLGFLPELPNPIPEVEQETLGYPITLQVGLPDDGKPPVAIDMELSLDGKPVDCYSSTPSAPTNPEMAPRNAFCLMPKATLLPGKLYTVTATWKDSGKKLTWSFRT